MIFAERSRYNKTALHCVGPLKQGFIELKRPEKNYLTNYRSDPINTPMLNVNKGRTINGLPDINYD